MNSPNRFFTNRNAVSTTRIAILFLVIFISLLALLGPLSTSRAQTTTPTPTVDFCLPFRSVATPLTDLGNQPYIRMGTTTSTGYIGGLYPDGQNTPPAAHATAAAALAAEIQPRDENGNIDPMNGKIVMVSIGMSNTSMEFGRFKQMVESDPEINPALIVVNGAQANMTADVWVDPTTAPCAPNCDPWDILRRKIERAHGSAAQVQVAWIKNTHRQGGAFPERAQLIQADFERIAQILKERYPNLKIAFYSSRIRSYLITHGLSPEPVAYETGFAVRWMIEKQINGNPSLNYDPQRGQVEAPLLLWGPYLWADGINPRSDGLTWEREDLLRDCTHPSDSGIDKVATMLMEFFSTDPRAAPWFLADGPVITPTPPPTELPYQQLLPLIRSNTATPEHTPVAEPGQTAGRESVTESSPSPPTNRTPAPEATLKPTQRLRASVQRIITGAAVAAGGGFLVWRYLRRR